MCFFEKANKRISNLEQNSFVTLTFVFKRKKGFLLQFQIAYSFLRHSKQHIKKNTTIKRYWLKWNKKPKKKIDLETCLFSRDNDDEPRREPNMYRKSNFVWENQFLTFFFLLLLMKEWLTYFKNSYIVKNTNNKRNESKITQKIVSSVEK